MTTTDYVLSEAMLTDYYKRCASHLIECERSAERVVRALAGSGIESLLFGSVMRHQVSPASDLDILVQDRHGISRGIILCIAEEASTVEVDIIFAEDTSEVMLERIKTDIQHHR
jgi:predicted nucleotidyltransferase